MAPVVPELTKMHPDLIEALRRTASCLEAGADYRWTHMGSCNCGHLAQTVTRLPKEEIHRLALEKAGDWGEQAREYCPTSGYPIDHVLRTLFELGLSRDDVWHLERLSDPDALRRLPIWRGSRFPRSSTCHWPYHLFRGFRTKRCSPWRTPRWTTTRIDG